VTPSGLVFIVIGCRAPQQERYIIAVYRQAAGAEAQAARWRRAHPRGIVDVERYTVLD